MSRTCSWMSTAMLRLTCECLCGIIVVGYCAHRFTPPCSHMFTLNQLFWLSIPFSWFTVRLPGSEERHCSRYYQPQAPRMLDPCLWWASCVLVLAGLPTPVVSCACTTSLWWTACLAPSLPPPSPPCLWASLGAPLGIWCVHDGTTSAQDTCS
jgi:hypothetical protein